MELLLLGTFVPKELPCPVTSAAWEFLFHNATYLEFSCLYARSAKWNFRCYHFCSQEWQFHGTYVLREQMFHRTFIPRSESSMEWKFRV